MIKVSIVVPVYNCKDYLRKCVTTLINQSLNEIEIILVDDGSTDGGSQLCDELSKEDERIVVIHQENAGVSAARNAGIMLAKGEYIGFSDGDDFSHKLKYEFLYNNAIETDSDVSVCGFYVYYSEDRIDGHWGTGNKYIWEKGNPEPLQMGLDSRVITMAPYAMIIRRELCKNNLFEVGRRINEDRYFGFMIYAKAFRIVYQDTCLYYYVQRTDSVAHGYFNQYFLDCLYFAEKIEDFARTNIPEIVDNAYLNTCRTYLNVLKYLLKSPKGKKEYYQEMQMMILKVKSYGLKYLFQNLSIVRFVDMLLMCWYPDFYSILIQIYRRGKV